MQQRVALPYLIVTSAPAPLPFDPALAALEAERHLSERRFRTLASATTAILWITRPDGQARADNPSWQAFTGQSPDQAAGWGWLDAIYPQDRELVLAQWRQGLVEGLLDQLEYRVQRHDGEYRWMASHGVPVLDDAGEVIEWIGHCTDVTETRRQQHELQASEERYRFLDELGQAARQLTDAASVMALTARLLGEHLGTTRCAYADVEPDNDRFTIRNDWSAPGTPTSAGVYSLDLFGAMARSDMRSGRTLIVHDVDTELTEGGGADMFNAIGVKAIICSPLVKDGRLIAMMAVHHHQPRQWTAHEVALVQEVVERCWAHIERVRDAAALREQDRRKDEFLATLAHELRNPLAPVRYAVKLLRNAPAGGSTSVQAQDVIDRQVGNMVRLIDDLLDLSRVSRGLIELKKGPVTLAEVVHSAVETSRPHIQAAAHELTVQLPSDEVRLFADATRLAQALGNLLNNAAKYTPDGGRLRLTAWAEPEAGRVVVEVADNGIGIPPEEQGRLFEMFTRLPHSAARSQGGLGIGLSLVKRLAEMHGGTVTAFSAGLDEGSSFRLGLPMLEVVPFAASHAAAAAAAVAAEAVAKRALAHPLRVLVVEDNPDGLDILLELLDLLNHEVRGAPEGHAALQLVDSFQPHVVLLDIGLPGLSGYEVARRLRADPRHEGLTLIALTGWGSVEDRRKTAEAGFDHHLTKPVDPDDLEALLSRLAPSS